MSPSDLSSLKETREFLEETRSRINGFRFCFSTEKELQDGLQQVLGDDWEREYSISQEDRLDFFHKKSGVALEAKIDHGLTPLTRQVHRYLGHDEIKGVLVVTTKVSLSNIPDSMRGGKPIGVVTLIGSIL